MVKRSDEWRERATRLKERIDALKSQSFNPAEWLKVAVEQIQLGYVDQPPDEPADMYERATANSWWGVQHGVETIKEVIAELKKG